MQLDLGFGEGEESTPRVLSVSELTRKIRTVLEQKIGEIWVRGEISNYRRQTSGHQYFTLKDDGCQLTCVLFASTACIMREIKLADGMQVQVFGELTVYETRGQYQLIVQLVQEEGLGILQARFEALKAKLAAEGLFSAERKRSLPRFPTRIGVVTSPTGAAIRDFLKVLHRRMPGIEILINPVRVQGRGASAEISGAVREFAQIIPKVDLIVIMRGGGSLEDLWEFNEEVVVRAIVNSTIPIVSAIGHEIDFTLTDFAADFRAPTPSAAAELIVLDATEIISGITQRTMRMQRECVSMIRFQRTHLAGHERSALYREPIRILRELRQRLDLADDAIEHNVVHTLQQCRDQLRQAIAVILARQPMPLLTLLRDRLTRSKRLLDEVVMRKLTQQREWMQNLVVILQTLSPHATLARGYSITFDAKGHVLRSAQDLKVGDSIRSRFGDGEVDAVIEEVRSI